MALYSDGTPKPRFRRFYTDHRPGQNGKGDWPRDRECSEEEYANNYCRTFGHQMKEGRCRNCGKPKENEGGEITAVQGEVPDGRSTGSDGDQTP